MQRANARRKRTRKWHRASNQIKIPPSSEPFSSSWICQKLFGGRRRRELLLGSLLRRIFHSIRGGKASFSPAQKEGVIEAALVGVEGEGEEEGRKEAID